MIRLLALLSIAVLSAAFVEDARAQTHAVVLVPGRGGVHPADFLIRNRANFEASGLAVAVADSTPEIAAAVKNFASKRMRVTIVGVSLGATKTARALAAGVRPNAVVLAAGILGAGRPRGVPAVLGSPSLLPPTLVLHNRQDACAVTSPNDVPGFVAWTRGRAQARWIDSGGGRGDPCGPYAPHAFAGADAQALGVIVQYARSR